MLHRPCTRRTGSNDLGASCILASSTSFGRAVSRIITKLGKTKFSGESVLTDVRSSSPSGMSNPIPIRNVLSRLTRRIRGDSARISRNTSSFSSLAVTLPSRGRGLPSGKDARSIPSSVSSVVHTSRATRTMYTRSTGSGTSALLKNAAKVKSSVGAFHVESTITSAMHDLEVPHCHLRRRTNLFSSLSSTRNRLFSHSSLLRRFVLTGVNARSVELSTVRITSTGRVSVSDSSRLGIHGLSSMRHQNVGRLFSHSDGRNHHQDTGLSLPGLVDSRIRGLCNTRNLGSFVGHIMSRVDSSRLRKCISGTSTCTTVVDRTVGSGTSTFHIERFSIRHHHNSVAVAPSCTFPSLICLPGPLAALSHALCRTRSNNVGRLRLRVTSTLTGYRNVV